MFPFHFRGRSARITSRKAAKTRRGEFLGLSSFAQLHARYLCMIAEIRSIRAASGKWDSDRLPSSSCFQH
jgi:hypothetical protein